MWFVSNVYMKQFSRPVKILYFCLGWVEILMTPLPKWNNMLNNVLCKEDFRLKGRFLLFPKTSLNRKFTVLPNFWEIYKKNQVEWIYNRVEIGRLNHFFFFLQRRSGWTHTPSQCQLPGKFMSLVMKLQVLVGTKVSLSGHR